MDPDGPEPNRDLGSKRRMQEEIQPPRRKTGLHGKERVGFIHEQCKPPNVPDQRIEDDVQKPRDGEKRSAKRPGAELLPLEQPPARMKKRGQSEPDNGPVGKITVMVDWPVIDRIEVEQVKSGANAPMTAITIAARIETGQLCS